MTNQQTDASDFTGSDQQTPSESSRAEQNTLRELVERLEKWSLRELSPYGNIQNAQRLMSQAASLLRRLGEPIKMVLFCPSCGLQHIDEPDERTPDWTNPPHRSHLCHGCGHIWRPADVVTEGVACISSVGKADSPTVRGQVATISRLQADLEEGRKVIEPLGKACAKVEAKFPGSPDEREYDSLAGQKITFGYLRRASSFLTKGGATVDLTSDEAATREPISRAAVLRAALADHDQAVADCPINNNRAPSSERCPKCHATSDQNCGPHVSTADRVVEAARSFVSEAHQ